MNQSIEQLRRARPAPVRLTQDPDGLFAAITSAPRESAPRRRPVRRRAVVVVAAVVGAIIITAGSAFAIANILGWHDAKVLVKTPGEWQALYVAAQRDLTLPPGQSWPQRSLPADSVTSRYQPGGEAVAIAQSSWECYWAHAIHTGDVAAQHRAHAALEHLLAHHIVVAPDGSSENAEPPSSVRMPVEIYADDGGIQYVQRMYDQAAAGHPALLDESCRANG